MWVDIGNVAFTDNGYMVSLSVAVRMLDRLKGDDTNSTSIWSDSLLLINDFYTLYNDNECEYGFFIDNPLAAERVYSAFDDDVNGYSANIIVKTGNKRDESQIPISR